MLEGSEVNKTECQESDNAARGWWYSRVTATGVLLPCSVNPVHRRQSTGLSARSSRRFFLWHRSLIEHEYTNVVDWACTALPSYMSTTTSNK